MLKPQEKKMQKLKKKNQNSKNKLTDKLMKLKL